ncbi:MAG: hypothetical protein DI630_32040 [Gordonia sp. (in: high G+C Gram-positive bacteria)]|nr:MAG: hypothetical protein DI630_32040 [Gordonia sp. (in: high G+C Gram-positive bacteria)]
MSDVRLKSRIGREGALAAVMVVAVTVLAVLASLVVPADPASAETPAERCARETAAYNSAWAQTWAASNGRPASEAPPPPVPYVCHDPGPTTTTTSQPPVVTAPTVPSDTNVPEGPGPNMGAHAPTDIPPPGSTPIVPIPTTGARDLGDDGDREGGDPRRTDPSRERPIPDLGSFRHNVDDDYDTNEIVGGPWEDTCGNKVPLRRGYWNGKHCEGYVECPGWMSSPKQIDKVSGIPLNGNDGGDAPVA